MVEGRTVLNGFGKIVCDEWSNMHGILLIVDVAATRRVAATKEGLIRPISDFIGAIVGQFKSILTKHINIVRNTPGLPTCQTKYHQHVIQNENELNRIREYIIDNPLYWQFDRENPRPAQEDVLYEMERF